MLNVFRTKPYINLNKIILTKSNIEHNYSYLSSYNPNLKAAPVLKSNAYGHGIVEIAKIVDPYKPPFLCVDSLFEAYTLLKAKIQSKILIMGYTAAQNLSVKKLPFSFAVFTKDLFEVIHKFQPHAGIHIFVDTGMSREGIQIKDLPFYLKYCLDKKIRIEGLMSHLAIADEPNNSLTKLQVKNFQKAIDICKSYSVSPRYVHLLASGGLLRSQNYPKESIGNMSRAGLALYGYDPVGKNEKLKPSLSFLTRVIQVKEIEKGEKIGYDGTFIAKKGMRIGILPVGYNDGVDRRLSNLGSVLIKDATCKILGRVSMNLLTVDVSDVKDIGQNDEVIVFSSDSNAINSIQNASSGAGMIPYDLLVGLSPFTKRIVM